MRCYCLFLVLLGLGIGSDEKAIFYIPCAIKFGYISYLDGCWFRIKGHFVLTSCR